MMAKIYGFYITVSHRVDVRADSKEEAEEIAMDVFSDEAGFWDDFDLELEFVEEE